MPVLRCYRVGFSFPIACERAAPCTLHFPLVFPSVLWPPEILHWNECVTPITGVQGVNSHVYGQDCTTTVCYRDEAPQNSLFQKREHEKDTLKYLWGWKVFLYCPPCCLLTDHSTSKPHMLCLVFFVCFSLPSSHAINSLLSLLWCFMLSRYANKIMM